MRFVPLIPGVILLFAFLKDKVHAYSLRETVLKALTSVMFMLTVFVSLSEMAFTPENLRFGLLMAAGLLFGLQGDIWLELKFVYPGQDTPYTYLGFASFSVGHLFYMAAMILTFGTCENLKWLAIPMIAGVVIGIGNGLLGKFMKLNYGDFKWVVMLYGAILFAMLLMAGMFALCAGFRSIPLNMIFAGGILFALSDLILSGTYFGVGKDRPVDLITNGATYYGAQFLIALAVGFLN